MTQKMGVDDFFAAGGDGASLEATAVAFDVWAAGVEEDEPEVGLVKELADAIRGTEAFAQDKGTRLYRYARGVYKPDGKEHVRRLVQGLLEDQKRTNKWTSHLANEVAEYVRVGAPLLWEEPPVDVLNVQNGLLDVRTRTLSAHNPAHLSPVQLPVAYDPTATCPAWETFVAQVFPQDAVDLAWEIPRT